MIEEVKVLTDLIGESWVVPCGCVNGKVSFALFPGKELTCGICGGSAKAKDPFALLKACAGVAEVCLVKWEANQQEREGEHCPCYRVFIGRCCYCANRVLCPRTNSQPRRALVDARTYFENPSDELKAGFEAWYKRTDLPSWCRVWNAGYCLGDAIRLLGFDKVLSVVRGLVDEG